MTQTRSWPTETKKHNSTGTMKFKRITESMSGDQISKSETKTTKSILVGNSKIEIERKVSEISGSCVKNKNVEYEGNIYDHHYCGVWNGLEKPC